MKDTDNYPETVRRYLCEVAESLAPLPAKDRREVLDGIAGHIEEALERGGDPESILSSLGTPEQVASEALDGQPGLEEPGYLNIKRVLQLIAVAATGLPVLAAKLIVLEVRYTGYSDGSEVRESVRLIDATSPILLLLPVLLSLAPLLSRGRAWQPVSVMTTALLTLYVVFASGTSGAAFLPAAVLAVAALFFPPRRVAPALLRRQAGLAGPDR